MPGNDTSPGIYLHPRKPLQFDAEVIFAAFELFSNSNDCYSVFEDLIIQVDQCFLPQGGRYLDLATLTLEQIDLKLRKKSLYPSQPFMKRNDKNCLAIAVALGVLLAKGEQRPSTYSALLKKRVVDEAERLAQLAGVDFATLDRLASIEEFEKFQQILTAYVTRAENRSPRAGPNAQPRAKSYKLVIYNRNAKPLFVGCNDDPNARKINLLLDMEHLDLIVSLTGVFSTTYFCEFCHTGYTGRLAHNRCIYTCDSCYQSPPCKAETSATAGKIECQTCCRKFYNNTCFNQHMVKKICGAIQFCNKCNRLKLKDHDCNTFYCATCGSKQPYEHTCYIPVYEQPKPSKLKQISVFYDIESMMVEKQDIPGEVHVPNLLVSNTICDACKNIPTPQHTCAVCGVREHVFRYETENPNGVIDGFLRLLFTLEKKFKVTSLAHNAGMYDLHFIMKRLFEVMPLIKPFIVMKGTKVFVLKVGNIRFIDSLNFACCGLAKLPKMFNLATNAKGFFPHKFNTLANLQYKGKYPDIEFYEPQNMNKNDAKSLRQWYETVKNDYFDFNTELLRYCTQDVDILRKFCVCLDDQIEQETGIRIFQEAVTLASFVSKVFRKKFYAGNLAIIPKNGYRLRDNQSIIALKYLKYLENFVYHTKIESAYRGFEKTIFCGNARYKVDGYFELNRLNADDTSEVDKYVVEFQGCRWHGHGCINKGLACEDSDLAEIKIRSLRREATKRKIDALKEGGFKVIEMWECEFREMLMHHMEIDAELGFINIYKLNPSDAFYGGNTDCGAIYHKASPDEKIFYYDVCSLYPYVNKCGKMAVGVPEIILDEACNEVDLMTFEGLVKVRVLPPKNLLHPVLPLKINGKLMFTLCVTCANEGVDGECYHTDDKRAFIGTYVADELRRGLVRGYKVLKVYELWKYEVVFGLFSDYVKHYQTEKLYASGLPEGLVDDQEIDDFLKEYELYEGVKLDRSKFRKNEAKRNYAKRQLNSLWGKFGESARSSTKIISEAESFAKMLLDPQITIRGFKVINENVMLVNYDNEDADVIKTANVVVCCYTTANARAILHTMIEAVGKAALYWDTGKILLFYI